MTAGEALRKYSSILKEQGVNEAEESVKVILCHVLNLNSSSLFANTQRLLTAGEISNLENLVHKRIDHMPVAYLVNNKEFYGLDLYIDGRVLVPRPETETLVEVAIRFIEEWKQFNNRTMLIADVGAGSGAISVALASNVKDIKIFAVDISREALDVAVINIKRYKLENRIAVVQGDLLQQVRGELDLVVANLPYIAEEDIELLPEEISRWEPRWALNGGKNGMEVMNKLIKQAAEKVNRGGCILLEIGKGQDTKICEIIMEILPQANTSLIRDMSGINRVVKIRIPHF